MELLRDWGYAVEERLITAEELFDAAESGKLNKLFPADVKTLFPDKAIKKRKQACNTHAVQHNAFIRHFA